jgi:organic radical activating enzyme
MQQVVFNHTYTLPLMEHFNTIQGEGFHAGKAAYFLRLGGCDIGCTWCDVKESWDANSHPQVKIVDMLRFIKECNAKTCVVTGGEPMLYNLYPLTDLLRQNHIQLHVESSGAYPITGNWNWITLSPKKFKKPQEENLKRANELKVVIYHPNDFRWAEENAEKVSEHCELYLQPEWGKSSEIIPLMVEYIKQNPKWKISLQIHKFMNIP